MCKKEKENPKHLISLNWMHIMNYIYEAWVYPPGLKNKANWCLKIKYYKINLMATKEQLLAGKKSTCTVQRRIA